jgi:hypothetical protein
MSISRKRRRAPARPPTYSDFSPTLLGLLQFAQAMIAPIRDVLDDVVPHTILACEDDASPPLNVAYHRGGRRPPIADLVGLQASFHRCVRCAQIEVSADRVLITARDRFGGKLSSEARITGGQLEPWSAPLAELESGLGLLGVPLTVD